MRLRASFVVLVTVSLAAACAKRVPPAGADAAPTASVYPPAPLGDVVEWRHGARVPDPYRWMETMDSPETRAWVVAENAMTDAYLAQYPGRDALHARIAELVRHETFGVPWRRGARYFWMHNDGQQNQSVLSTAPSLDATPTLLLDPNAISADGSLALAGIASSGDGNRIAYGLSIGGGDWQKWRVRDAASGKDLPDELEHIKYYLPAFNRDGTGLHSGTKYPPTLVVTSDFDVRVAPLHSYKYAAALQAAQAGAAPVLLRVQTTSGHGGGSTLSQEIDQKTEIVGEAASRVAIATTTALVRGRIMAALGSSSAGSLRR
jgi:prolyl oligopeptidase PreP (S9A serine peptidase family)